MKELTIEQKAKAYDGNYKAYTELINRLEDVKDAIKKQNYGIAMDILCKPYPEFQVTTHSELKESENERIRLELIRDIDIAMPIETAQKYITWLKKQGEQRTNRLVWKHWKDGIAGNGEGKLIYLVKMNNTYRLTSCLGFECDYIELSELDNLLSEKQGEQKPADKIQLGKKYKCIASPRYSTFMIGKIYKPEDKFLCSLMNFFSDFFEPIEEGEQKPVYEMKSAEESLGIDSDTYNKIVDECIFGEQKPAWSEEDEAILEKCIGAVKVSCYSCSFKSEAENWLKSLKDKCIPQPKQEWSEENESILFRTINNLKFLKDTVSIDPNYAINITDMEREINWLESLKDRTQPKQEWSEEDVNNLNRIAVILNEAYQVRNWWETERIITKLEAIKLTDFLKSLKDRIQPQPKQEWSEEDERERKHCIDFLNHPDLIKTTPTIVDNCKNWLKFLKPQNRWKPSDEQIEALEKECIAHSNYELCRLLEQLKKLKG